MENIAVVDDNALSVEGICAGINWAEIDAVVSHVFYDAQSLLWILPDENVDLVISDIKMPDIDGLEMSREILKQKPGTKIILISAYDNFEYAKQAIRIGAFDYVEKPIDYQYLGKIIKSAVAQIERERYNLELLKKSRPIMIDNFYKDLIHTGADESQFALRDYRSYLNIDSDYSYFNCSVISIKNSMALKESLGIERYHILLMGLCDHIKDVFKEFEFVYTISEKDTVIVILAANAQNENSFIEKINEQYAPFVKKYIDRSIILNIGIGNVVSILWGIRTSYENAKAALDSRFFFPQKYIFDIRDSMNKKNDSRIWLEDIFENKMIEYICKMDLDSLKDEINALNKLYLEHYCSKGHVFVSIYSILSKILKFLFDIGVPADDIQKKIFSAYNELEKFATNDQICQWLFQVCADISVRMKQSVEGYHSQICKSVCDFIQNNYANPKLCLNDIASFVNLSPAHLSMVFKKTNGQNISDLITNVRMEEAQRMLKYTGLSVNEISERVGYSNQFYFSTCFKKKTGKTPSAYRLDSAKEKVTN